MSTPRTPDPSQWSRMRTDEESAHLKHRSSVQFKYQAANPAELPSPRRPYLLRHSFTLLALSLVLLALVEASRPGPGLLGSKVTRKARPRSNEETYMYATPSPELAPFAPHPIKELMERARRRWDKKVARQSKTYEEAVVEYRRRYRRPPPRGFRAWYDYARDNNVQLIDEYDHIWDDVALFHALPPSELRNRIEQLRKSSKNYAFLQIRDGDLTWSGAKWREVVPEVFTNLIAEFLPLLPTSMDFAVYLHDGPATFLDAEVKRAYSDASAEGRWIDESTLLMTGRPEWSARSNTCGPGSRLRRSEVGLDNVHEAGPAFISNHLAAMSYCLEPSTLGLHGSTFFRPHLGRIEPTFSLSKTNINSDLLWPAPIQYTLNPDDELPFADKPFSKLVWRGSLDGVSVEEDHPWRHSHRFRAIYLTTSDDKSETRKVRLTRRDMFGREYQHDGDFTLGELNERYMNVKPTFRAVQCHEVLCKHIDETLPFVEKASLEEMAAHRYVLDIDGNSYSARFRTHLLSNQVVLKSTRFPEWYTGRIEPWLHYVPLRQDYADLYDIMAYFSGDPSPQRVGHHDAAAERIAVAGRAWAEQHWRPEDVKAYFFRLILEYGRLMDLDRKEEGNATEDAGAL